MKSTFAPKDRKKEANIVFILFPLLPPQIYFLFSEAGGGSGGEGQHEFWIKGLWKENNSVAKMFHATVLPCVGVYVLLQLLSPVTFLLSKSF